MRKGFWFVLIFIGFMFWSKESYAQFYQNAAGLRIGPAWGISGKTLMTKRIALEGMITSRWGGVNVTALAEMTQPLMPIDILGLSWYYGLGANVGFWDYPKDEKTGADLFIGVDGILGAEYTFEAIPLNVALDWKPYFNIITTTHFVGNEISVSARYVFNY